MKTLSTSLLGTALSLVLMTMNPCISRVAAQHDHAPASTAVAAQEPVYSCPMHPEVTGKKGDTCPKCHMALVAPKDVAVASAAMYCCPMHPDAMGAKDAKCPKCGMAMTTAVYACPMHPDAMGAKDAKCAHCGMAMTQPVALYACPMHPEVTGMKGDKCSKCDMALQPAKAK